MTLFLKYMAITKFFLLSLILIGSLECPAQQLKTPNPPTAKQGAVVTEHLVSEILKENLIGIDANRTIKVYLPPGYATSRKSYPVVYYCHNMFYSAERLFSETNLAHLFERSFTNNVIAEFIFVAADYSSPTIGSIFENSTVSGRWLDFTVKELVPYIDKKFRTLANRNSRAVTGDFMGARGALKLAMIHAEVFGVVYALHPVATGRGYLPWATIPINWNSVYQAKTFAELEGREKIFVAIAQAFLPNPNRPPFYCDYWMELVNGKPTINAANVRKAQQGFHLDDSLDESADNLRTMNAIAFDWARYDETTTHVYTNQEFTRKLDDLGIDHEAEEYHGTASQNWGDYGRVYTRMLPFFARHLVFEP